MIVKSVRGWLNFVESIVGLNNFKVNYCEAQYIEKKHVDGSNKHVLVIAPLFPLPDPSIISMKIDRVTCTKYKGRWVGLDYTLQQLILGKGNVAITYKMILRKSHLSISHKKKPPLY